MSSVLSSFFSRDPRTSFPYSLPTETFTVLTQELINVGKSLKKSEPQEKATCFWTLNANSTSLKIQAQKLKTLRHPNVLAYLDSLEVEGSFYLITEPCRPLAYYLSETKLTSTQLELVVSWGLYQVLNCLKFLHNEAKLSQNNMRNAIFVTSSGDWKLAAFQNSGSLSSPQVDLNDLASVVLQIFTKNDSLDISSPSALSKIPKRIHPLYKRLCAKLRSVMTVGDILNECRANGGFMKNKFVDTLLFLDEFQLREAPEKQSFFVRLNTNLELFPEDIARNKILPKLIHTYEYGDAGAHILLPMFKLGKLLDEDEYQQRIVPCLVKLFSSSDRTTRLFFLIDHGCHGYKNKSDRIFRNFLGFWFFEFFGVKLLEKIDEFSSRLKPQVVNDKIYPNLITGFLDSNSAVRESTVKAIVSFADKLNYNHLNNDLMKYLAKLQGSDPEPSIRTNTTICLGKIGCFIDASHRQRILISAFTRALKDPFPPARLSGVIALSATQQYFSLNEVAQKVLPNLSPLAVDPEKQVRDQTFKALSGFLEKLQKASDNPELIAEMEAQVKAGGKVGLLSGDKVPHWAGWAIKAISGKFYKSTTPTPETTTTEQQNVREVSSTKIENEKNISKGNVVNKMEDKKEATQNINKNISAISDGWGDEELSENGEEEEEENQKYKKMLAK
uniref:Protein kinase domain-containing protein n=1 Tax=Meloidogyne incognita TaxID=6306 RepID=A0A914MUB5_MELIC